MMPSPLPISTPEQAEYLRHLKIGRVPPQYSLVIPTSWDDQQLVTLAYRHLLSLGANITVYVPNNVENTHAVVGTYLADKVAYSRGAHVTLIPVDIPLNTTYESIDKYPVTNAIIVEVDQLPTDPVFYKILVELCDNIVEEYLNTASDYLLYTLPIVHSSRNISIHIYTSAPSTFDYQSALITASEELGAIRGYCKDTTLIKPRRNSTINCIVSTFPKGRIS